MDPRTRMATVLVVLAGGMTCTAALLSWMNPGWPEQPHTLSPERLLQLTRSVVFESTAVEPDRWHAVDIVAGPLVSSRSALLRAASVDGAHFIVDVNGRLARSRRWASQQVYADWPNTVRVQVSDGAGEPGLTLAQWSTLQALTATLNEAVARELAPLPVHIEPALSTFTARPAGSIRSDIPRRRAG